MTPAGFYWPWARSFSSREKFAAHELAAAGGRADRDLGGWLLGGNFRRPGTKGAGVISPPNRTPRPPMAEPSPLSASAAATRALNSEVRCLLFRFIGLISGQFAPLRPAKVAFDRWIRFPGPLQAVGFHEDDSNRETLTKPAHDCNRLASHGSAKELQTPFAIVDERPGCLRRLHGR